MARNILADVLDQMRDINSRNNYGHIAPFQEFGNIVKMGTEKYNELQHRLKNYNRNKPSNQRYKDVGIDNYSHRYTTYKAAQQGPILGTVMLGAGIAKEIPDFIKYSLKYNPSVAMKEGIKDLTEDWRGYKMGMNNKKNPEDNPTFNKYNSGTVNFLLSDILSEEK